MDRWRIKKGKLLFCIFFLQLVPFIYYLLTIRSSPSLESVWKEMEQGKSNSQPTNSTSANPYSRLTPEEIEKAKFKENSCKIPTMDPFDPKMTPHFKPFTVDCSKKDYYFRSDVEAKTDQPFIVIKKTLPNNFSCCYEHLRFGSSAPFRSMNFENDTCTVVRDNKTVIPTDSQYIIINCWDKNDSSVSSSRLRAKSIIHRELLFYIPKPKVPPPSKNTSDDKLNVIIMGFDQVSRMNFIRLMGNTFHYLKSELEAIDLQGFNKVGDATLNNTLAFMTGRMFGEIKEYPEWWKGKRDDSNEDTFFDDCPWIWKDFAKKGYLTVYGDDYESVFNFRFKGFRKQPTDYYLQPFLHWFDPREPKFGSSDCIGDEPALHLLQNLARKTSSSLRDHPYFHFMWNSRIHEKAGYPSVADNATLNTLEYFGETGVLNKSLVILLSDHGWRIGPAMENEQARTENKMPFAFLLLPKWFRESYSEAYRNLLENQYRLTTPYDIHATLLHILNYKTELTNEAIWGQEMDEYSESRGISLFLPISKERSCEQAGIDETWCGCSAYKQLLIYSPLRRQLGQFAIETINSWLKPFSYCRQYELDKVLRAEVKANSLLDDTLPSVSKIKGNQTFRLSFSVKPTENFEAAQFEVTIFLNGEYPKGDKRRVRMSTEVFRLTGYGATANCMPVYSLKKICTCDYSLIKRSKKGQRKNKVKIKSTRNDTILL